MWILMAVFSAVFAALTSILAKCGIKKTDSDVATALRTIVVLAFAWLMVAVVGSAGEITSVDAKSLLFLVLSGLATGGAWLCYYKALSVGDVNKVVPVDKSSTVLTMILAIVVFGETEHLWIKLGATLLLGIGIFLMIEKKQKEGEKTGNGIFEEKGFSGCQGGQKGAWFYHSVRRSDRCVLALLLLRGTKGCIKCGCAD